MAHRTRSKEQYKIQFYKFKISFKSRLRSNLPQVNSLDALLMLIMLSKKNLPQFETNVLFLKSLKF